MDNSKQIIALYDDYNTIIKPLIADGILRFLKQKQIYITEVFYMHILRVLLQKQSQLRQKLQ